MKKHGFLWYVGNGYRISITPKGIMTIVENERRKVVSNLTLEQAKKEAEELVHSDF